MIELQSKLKPNRTGTATPRLRRNSTNPFEILSPEDEDGPLTFVDNDGNLETNKLNNNSASGNVASAIADMTADFYNSIAALKSYDFESKLANVDNQKDDEENAVFEPADDVQTECSDANANHTESPQCKTVSTVILNDNDRINEPMFDPFATIHDDEGNTSSSLEHSSLKDVIGESFSQSENIQGNKSSKAKDLFNSSMASIELMAAAGNYDDSKSPESQKAEHDAFMLAAPGQGMELNSNSDVSDLSDVSRSTSASNIRSAFNMYSGKKNIF